MANLKKNIFVKEKGGKKKGRIKDVNSNNNKKTGKNNLQPSTNETGTDNIKKDDKQQVVDMIKNVICVLLQLWKLSMLSCDSN